jgi:uncharacterized protein (UPF0276 family)
MYKIASPISHLFHDLDDSLLISSYSDCLECRDHSPAFEISKQQLFHFEIQPIHKLRQDDFDYIEKIINEKYNLELISFHMATCYQSPGIKDRIFVPGGYKYELNEMIDNSIKNFSKIKSITGTDISIAIENNNYYKNEAYEVIAEPEFIKQVVSINKINFLFDIAHAKVSARNMGISYLNYVQMLPMEEVVQLHICKYGIENKLAYDAHFAPDDEEYEEIVRLISICKKLKYFTIEYYKDTLELMNCLTSLKKILNFYA